MAINIKSAEFIVDASHPVLAVSVEGGRFLLSADSQKPYVLEAGLIAVPGLRRLGLTESVETISLGKLGGAITTSSCVRDAGLVKLFLRFLDAARTLPWPVGPFPVS